MKRLIPLIIFVLTITGVFAQTTTTRILNWDGIDREYIEYIPSIYDGNTAAPVVFCLHGLGDNMSNFSGIGFQQIADQTGWIVITPQALMATIQFVGDLGTAWNSGAGIENAPMLGNVILNEGVDDSGFLMAVLDSLENNYNINTDSVFFTGFSLGGFMSNRMGAEHSDRITAIASVSGTIGKFFTPNPAQNIKAMHIHGDSDSQIAYEDAGFDTGMGVYSIGMGAEECVEYWRSFNNSDPTPIVTYYPDTQADGKTFERYFYDNGDNGSYNAFIKVIGGDHEWYYAPVNDIDYTTEIYKFFTNTMDFPTTITEKDKNIEMSLYPNPASSTVHISTKGINNYTLELVDITGKSLLKTSGNKNNAIIDISTYPQGMYFVSVKSDKENFVQKLIIR